MSNFPINGRPERDFGMEGLDDEEFLLEANTYLDQQGKVAPLPATIGDTDPPPRSVQLYVGYFLFFLCGIGLSMAWYPPALQHLMNDLKEYGPDIYQLFLAGYNVPALPLLLAQTKWDGLFDAKYGSLRAYWVRLTSVVVILGGAVGVLPYLPLNKYVLLGIVGLVGVFDSVGFGAFSQLASSFPEKCITFVFMGQSMSSILLLIITILTKFSTYPPPDYAVRVYFAYAAFWVILGFIAWAILARSNFGKYYLSRASISSQTSINEERAPVTVKAVFQRIWKVIFACTFLWFGILMVSSYFTRVPAQDPSPAGESQMTTVLIYLNLFGSFVGKQLALIKKSPVVGQRTLLLFVLILNLFLIPFHLFVSEYAEFPKNDIVVWICVGVFCILSGYLGSFVYIIGGREVAPSQRALATSVLNIFLQVGVIAGVMTAILLTTFFPYNA